MSSAGADLVGNVVCDGGDASPVRVLWRLRVEYPPDPPILKVLLPGALSTSASWLFSSNRSPLVSMGFFGRLSDDLKECA